MTVDATLIQADDDALVRRRFWRLVIEGEPVPKGRPRATLIRPKGRPPFISQYTPAETRKYEDMIRDHAALAWRGEPLQDTALTVLATFYRTVPISYSNTKRRNALDDLIRPTGKPDLDNLLKSITDALNGIVYRDDAMIVEATASKRYALRPHAAISISWMAP